MGEVARCDGAAQQKAHGLADGEIGGVGQGLSDAHDGPGARQVSQSGQKGDFGLVDAQPGHGVGHRGCGQHGGGEGVVCAGVAGLGGGGEQALQAGRIGSDQPGEVGRGGGDGGKQSADGWVGEEGGKRLIHKISHHSFSARLVTHSQHRDDALAEWPGIMWRWVVVRR